MINANELFELAKLSKFEVPNTELESFCREMNEIVDFINISHSEYEGETVFSRDGISFRDDEPKEFERDDLLDRLSISPSGYFAVRREGINHE